MGWGKFMKEGTKKKVTFMARKGFGEGIEYET